MFYFEDSECLAEVNSILCVILVPLPNLAFNEMLDNQTVYSSTTQVSSNSHSKNKVGHAKWPEGRLHVMICS